jgi:hypothetical protein
MMLLMERRAIAHSVGLIVEPTTGGYYLEIVPGRYELLLKETLDLLDSIPKEDLPREVLCPQESYGNIHYGTSMMSRAIIPYLKKRLIRGL